MSSDNIVGIDIPAVQGYQEVSLASYRAVFEHCGEFDERVNGLLSYDDSEPLHHVIYQADKLIAAWKQLNSYVDVRLVLIMNPPAFEHPEPFWVPEAGVYIVLDGAEQFRTDYTKLRKVDQLVVRESAPDIVLEMTNVPPHIRKEAEESYYRAIEDSVPLVGGELRVEAELDVLWIELSAELCVRQTVYADGSVELEFEAIGELGAEAGFKLADVEAGVELSILLSHEFDSVVDAERYKAELVGTLLSVGGLPRAVSMLTSGPSIRSATTKAGVYVSAEVEFGDLLEVEGRLSTGIGRDWVKEENLLYFSGSLALDSEVVSAEVEVVGEWRKGVDTERVVIDGTFQAEAQLLSDVFELPEDIAIAGGMEVEASLELDLEDRDQRRAWSDFRRGRLSFGELLQHGSVSGVISTTATVSHDEFDVVVLEVEAEATARSTVATFHKRPARPMRWMSAVDIARLS